jgi:hypothetical protein
MMLYSRFIFSYQDSKEGLPQRTLGAHLHLALELETILVSSKPLTFYCNLAMAVHVLYNLSSFVGAKLSAQENLALKSESDHGMRHTFPCAHP